jgi:hypothetical protein
MDAPTEEIHADMPSRLRRTDRTRRRSLPTPGNWLLTKLNLAESDWRSAQDKTGSLANQYETTIKNIAVARFACLLKIRPLITRLPQKKFVVPPSGGRLQ